MTIAPLDPDACYAAIVSRDPAVDGSFFSCVATTRIFCRPVCPARTPLPKNVIFVRTTAEAVTAGYRACKRCRPDAAPGSAAWDGTAASVHRALALIDAGGLDETKVDVLGNRLGLGERQVRRLFGKHLGAPPVAVAQAKRLAAANELIAGTLPLAQVALAAGFGSVRRFNELYRAVHGETPAAYRARHKGTAMHLTLSRYTSPVGEILLVTEGSTLRALDFGDYEARMTTLLSRHYGAVALVEGDAPAAVTAALDAYFAGDATALDALPVATGGSEFQRSVWAALRAIPAGTTTGYGALAAVLGKPGAARAVGLANGANPIGIVVPCHRVIGANGALTGYAGGVARKEWLLRHEGAITG
ncbi:bifunctional transcriptional activator/DNA repair enzyme AdaA [Glacieibacterium megasporae]|uniref:bifunctional transcriptional activator/DNA repair enzyme AdaA n=1 Tax=Glacieibacterium megasporae TaxID=2835787 RepID=UPI001C1E4867|nr:methylated-DNA--[protein]-cysteine S-methyltransferase [Polymorphobacter megasporae]UAJ08991.1 methylated-DNA--[protein]-cysteine S-methyltransferase [Polymorphobacter megasporae]